VSQKLTYFHFEKSLYIVYFGLNRKWRAKYINNISSEMLPIEIDTRMLCFTLIR
jgi:hypothetical protein